MFYYVVDNEVVYMCMADKDFKRRIPFAYLNDIKTRFEEMYGATIKTAVELNMNEEFSKVMEKRMVNSLMILHRRSSSTTIPPPMRSRTSAARSRK